MEIIKIKLGDPDFKLFESLPGLLYPADSIRHKQKESINKEFFEACYVLCDQAEPKARVALYNNPYLLYNGMKPVCIGNYESINNTEVANKLLEHVTSEAQKLGATFLIGPMNGSTWDNYRFSAHNEFSNFLLEPYNRTYYNDQFTDNGFDPIAHYSSNLDTDIQCDPPNVLKLDEAFSNAGVTIRSVNLQEYENELKQLYPFISNSFKSNFLYTPISWETFRDKYMEAAKIINPDYTLIAEDENRNIIGFIFCYDDLFNTAIKSIVIKTLVRNEDKKWSGLGSILANRIIRLVKSKGYKAIVHAFIINQGTSTGVSNVFSGAFYKNYVLYGKKISNVL